MHQLQPVIEIVRKEIKQRSTDLDGLIPLMGCLEVACLHGQTLFSGKPGGEVESCLGLFLRPLGVTEEGPNIGQRKVSQREIRISVERSFETLSCADIIVGSLHVQAFGIKAGRLEVSGKRGFGMGYLVRRGSFYP